MAKTLQDLRKERAKTVESNRALGVLDYTSSEPKSERVFEIVEGAHNLSLTPARKGNEKGTPRDTRRIGPGHRFHPTESQVKQFDAGKGGLVGKARELTASEIDGLGRESRKPRSTGADIGLRSLKMDKDALKAALDAKLSEEDFADIAPAGRFGRYTIEQVNEVIQAKREN